MWGAAADQSVIDLACREVFAAAGSRFPFAAVLGTGIFEYAPGSAIAGKVTETGSDADWSDLSLTRWIGGEISFQAQPKLGGSPSHNHNLTTLWREAGNVSQYKSPRVKRVRAPRKKKAYRSYGNFETPTPTFAPVLPRREIAILCVLADFPDIAHIQEADELHLYLEEEAVKAIWSKVRDGHRVAEFAEALLDPYDASATERHHYLEAKSPIDEFVTLIDEARANHESNQVRNRDREATRSFFANFDFEGDR